MPIYRHPLCAESAAAGLRDLPLDDALICRLESSFGALEAQGVALAETFFERLAVSAPELRALLPLDLAEQARNFMRALAFLVENLRQPELVTGAVRACGERLRKFGVRAEHVPALQDALLAATGQSLGRAWTPELRAEWTEALRLAGSLLLEGAGARLESGLGNPSGG